MLSSPKVRALLLNADPTTPEYLNSFTNLDEKELVQIILVAIKVSHHVENEDLMRILEGLKTSDPN